MRHKVDGRKFGRSGSHRKAMFRNLMANLIIHEKIKTTDAKAKELRRIAEALITKAKTIHTEASKLKGSSKGKKEKLKNIRLKVYRELKSFLPWEAFDEKGVGISVVGKLMDEIAPRYKDINGGYTRVLKIGFRRGDNAPLSVIEFRPVHQKREEEKDKTKRKKSKFFTGGSKKETLRS